jgi:hypothetical protein
LGLALDESKDTKENLMDIDKIKILIGDNVISLMGDSTPLSIEFQDNSYGKGFTINTGFGC